MYRASIPAFLLLALLATACSLRSGNLEPDSSSADGASTTKEIRSSTTSSTSAVDDEVCRAEPGPSRRDQVCHRWRCDGRDASVAARWSGELSSCSAGDLDGAAAERALRLVNLHRFLAGVEPVTAEATWTGAAQQCALVAHANGKLSHTPSPDWRCWSDVAALTSSVSLIANRSAPPAIAAFIEDPGNEATMVHRRWLLSEELKHVGFGSTDRYSCVVVDGRSLDAAANAGAAKTVSAPVDDAEHAEPRGWVAWPPPGPVPLDVFRSERLDEIGWTVQSSSDDLDHATVSVTSEGTKLPITTTALEPLEGSRSAIRFVPEGWKTESGRAYVVSVEGTRALEYTVEPTGCE